MKMDQPATRVQVKTELRPDYVAIQKGKRLPGVVILFNLIASLYIAFRADRWITEAWAAHNSNPIPFPFSLFPMIFGFFISMIVMGFFSLALRKFGAWVSSTMDPTSKSSNAKADAFPHLQISFSDELASHLGDLESKRRKKLFIVKLIFLTTIPYAIFVWDLSAGKEIGNGADGQVFITALATVFYIAFACFLPSVIILFRLGASVNTELLTRNLVSAVFPGYVSDASSDGAENFYKNCPLKQKYTSFTKYFYGSVPWKNQKSQLASFATTSTSGSGKNRKTVVNFCGNVLRLDIPGFPQNYKLGIGMDLAQRVLGGFLGSLVQDKLGNFIGMDPVRLEDPGFEERYAVYSNDQIQTRKILTPSVMQEFVTKLQDPLWGSHQIRWVLQDSSLYIIQEYARGSESSFAFNPLRKIDDPAAYKALLDTLLELHQCAQFLFEKIERLNSRHTVS